MDQKLTEAQIEKIRALRNLSSKVLKNDRQISELRSLMDLIDSDQEQMHAMNAVASRLESTLVQRVGRLAKIAATITSAVGEELDADTWEAMSHE